MKSHIENIDDARVRNHILNPIYALTFLINFQETNKQQQFSIHWQNGYKLCWLPKAILDL